MHIQVGQWRLHIKLAFVGYLCSDVRVPLTLEHVEHAFRDDKATRDVHACQKNRGGTQRLRDRGGQISAAHDEHSTDADHT